MQRIAALLTVSTFAISGVPAMGQVEPNAGNWKTWVISSGKDFRVPPPPGAQSTQAELEWLRSFVAESDPRIAQQVKFWDAGPPSYRWIDLISNRFLTGQPLTAYPHRVYTYVAQAMYDATVAAWDSKYAYNRQRPNQVDPTIPTRVTTPRSPSYPSDYAATAAAAAAVLGFFIPAEADSLRRLGEEAAISRLYAGVEFPSDYHAGLELGRQVAARVIERARQDGSDFVWTGSIPTGQCMWTGTNPGNISATQWRPILLSSPSEFRPPVPPACDSPEVTEQVGAVKAFARGPAAFATNHKAMYWQSPEGIQTWPYRYANTWIFEERLDQNPPRAARVYALLASSMFDVFIASQDGKFAHWYLRPHQLDTGITPLFPVPNFPSYPSNHSSFSATRSEMLAYLFPRNADFIRGLGKEAGDSRIWAGIHYQIDNEAGGKLGRSVAQKFIDWANADGSQ